MNAFNTSLVDSVDIRTGALLDRLTDVAKPCCIERIPSESASPVRALVSHIVMATPPVVYREQTVRLALGPRFGCPHREATCPGRPNQ